MLERGARRAMSYTQGAQPAAATASANEVACFQPRLVRLWNRLASGEARPQDFAPEAVMGAATRRAGLEDFGERSFIEGLRVFLDSFILSPQLHAFGRFYARQMVVAMLTHRLKLTELLKTRPEVLDQPISRPIFVLGLPRSGTSLLFNLLARDRAHRCMHNWESFIGQVPPRGRYTFATDPRRGQAKWVLRVQKYLMPEIDAQHEFLADGPEECTPILMQGFATQAFAGGFDVPAYAEWLDGADHAPTYRHHKRVLQALQWKYPGERWLLKSPDHVAAVDAILRVYPDACFVHIHRDPVKAVSSWASLNQTYRGVYYRRVDRDALGEQVLTRLAHDMRRCQEDRARHGAERFIDVRFGDLMRHPVEVVREIYAKFGFPLNSDTEGAMRAFLAENPMHKHGVHRYEPEDFGLCAETIRQRFAEYIDTFKAQPGRPAG